MANFFLIDHSLSKPGGHHFDYVRCVAQAASNLGLLTTIGANRSLKQDSTDELACIEQFGNVRSVFRDTTYQQDSYLAGLQHLTRSNCVPLTTNNHASRVDHYRALYKRFRQSRRRAKFVRRFAQDCERYFRPLMQLPGDHAFLTTVSELELMGLAVYLSNHPKTVQTHWHLQFHFNLYDGRTPEYAGQEHISKAVRSCCLAALSRLPTHSINFYTTSDTLVDQYNRLGVGEFELLPYPISPEFTSNAEDGVFEFGSKELERFVDQSEKRGINKARSTQFGPSLRSKLDLAANVVASKTHGIARDQGDREFGRPLKITCPGEVRREKGHVEYLQPLVNEIWPAHLSTGNVQIVVQRPAKKWHSRKEKIEISIPDSPAQDSGSNRSPIEYFSHPLSHEDYVQLIKSTDCGLLFYDSKVYFSRRAGVLGELLACGKPVIVPAGCWLAEQIAEPIFQHVDHVVEQSTELRTIESGEFSWDSRNVPMPGGVLSFDQSNHPFDFSVTREKNEHVMVLEFDWHWPKAAGTYCRIEMNQNDAAGDVIGTSRRVIGFRRSSRPVRCLLPLNSKTCSVDFSLTNAFHNSTASINRARLRTFDSPQSGLPIGSVGVVASDQADLPNCVDEVVNHFDHYRKSAMAYSGRWFSQHDPNRTVNHLISANGSQAASIHRVA